MHKSTSVPTTTAQNHIISTDGMTALWFTIVGTDLLSIPISTFTVKKTILKSWWRDIYWGLYQTDVVSYIWRTGSVGQGVSSALLYFIIMLFCDIFIKNLDIILDHILITCADLTLIYNAKQPLAKDVYGFGGGVLFITKKAQKAQLPGYKNYLDLLPTKPANMNRD